MFNQFNENIRQIYLASCLYDCIEDNNVNAIETLLEKNYANPNIVLPDKGVSPFHLIIGYPDETTAENVTKLFLRYGGDSNVRSEDNMTPVHVAAAWGRETILNLLLNCGGDVTLKDDEDKTAYDYAIAEKHYSIVSLLRRLHDIPKSDVCDDGCNIKLHKVILENDVFVAEYGTDELEIKSIRCTGDCSSQLPQDELNSYVENWCAQNAKTDNKLHLEIDNLKPRKDEFVTRRRKHKTFFKIEGTTAADTVNERETENDQRSCNVITNIGRKLNDLNFEEKIEIFDRALGCKRRNFVGSDPRKDTLCSFQSGVSSPTDDSRNISPLSAESGLCAISSDFSIFANSLEPLYECKYIGEIDPKRSENSEYVTCEELDSLDLHEKNIFSLDSANDGNCKPDVHGSENGLNQTYAVDKGEVDFGSTDDSFSVTTKGSNIRDTEHWKNEAVVNVAEEYKYTDQQEGVVLIERRYLLNTQVRLDDSKNSTSSSLPTTIDYDTETLRKELTSRGEPLGPITSTTRRVYLKRLMRLQKTTSVTNSTCPETSSRVYSVELEKTLRSSVWTDDLTVYKELESAVAKQFNEPDPSKRWREGTAKASFTYLLMDPRLTRNLPWRAENMSTEECWKVFLSSIFYVGKGKRSRPYCHLYEAISHWNGEADRKPTKKIKHILDIWNEDKGIVCLHIFQNVIPVEAYTREAAIISALKLQNLKNAKAGDFYGVAATWSQRQKKLFGVYLLHRALFIFLNEGERQLRPDDI